MRLRGYEGKQERKNESPDRFVTWFLVFYTQNYCILHSSLIRLPPILPFSACTSLKMPKKAWKWQARKARSNLKKPNDHCGVDPRKSKKRLEKWNNYIENYFSMYWKYYESCTQMRNSNSKSAVAGVIKSLLREWAWCEGVYINLEAHTDHLYNHVLRCYDEPPSCTWSLNGLCTFFMLYKPRSTSPFYYDLYLICSFLSTSIR